MLMGAYDGGVDDQVLKVPIVRQRRENPMPHTFAAPAAKASEDAIPLAERRWQIAPRRAGAHDPKHTFHEHPVVAASGAALVRASDDQTRDPVPLPIAQNKPLRPQGCLPKSSLESRFDRFENPKSPQDLARDDFSSNRHPALAFWWSMIFSENRGPARIKSGPGFFGIML